MVPPVPIPNTVVKHPEAESTCLVTGWEDRKLPVNQGLAVASPFLFCYNKERMIASSAAFGISEAAQ